MLLLIQASNRPIHPLPVLMFVSECTYTYLECGENLDIENTIYGQR